MQIWLDGSVVSEQDARISVLDHGVTVGDGVFETLKVIDGVPFAMQRHLERLERSATGLGLPAPDRELVRKATGELLAGDQGSSRLRITYTGGVSPLGSDRGDGPPTLILALAPMPVWEESTTLVTVPWKRNEHSAVAGLKTTSYAENVVALEYAHQRGGGEALFTNVAGRLCEGTGSNVFVVVGGQVLTPPLSSGCLAGVTRALVIEWCGAVQTDLDPSVLAAAQEVFITSSTRDVQAVRAVDDRTYAAPGPVTKAAAATFAARTAQGMEP